MTFDPLAAARLLDACAAGIVLVGVLMAGTRSIGRAIWLVAAQAVLLARGRRGRRARDGRRATSSSGRS